MGRLALEEALRPRGTARQLAWLRILVPVTILLLPEVRGARAFASVDRSLWVAPEGLGWFVRWAPVGPVLATAVQAVCAAAALSAAAGLAARPALGVLAVAAFYLMALGQLSGSVWHGMHLLWMAALLACSPCDEALVYGRPAASSTAETVRHGAPLFFARLLLACVYFFPGVHKLVGSGLAWALSDNLRNQLWWKWAEHGAVPALRIDRYPALLRAGGLGVLAFELSMPLLVSTRRGRPLAAVCGLAFHAATQIFFGIPFASLWLLYVVLVDPHDVVRWIRRRSASPPAASAPPLATSSEGDRLPRSAVIAGAALLAAVAVQGARGQTQAFPFACYPTFAAMAGTEMPDLIVEVERGDGSREVVPSPARRSQREWGAIWSLAGVTAPVDPTRLRAYLATLGGPAGAALAGGASARIYRGYVSVVPGDAGRAPRRGPLLCEIRLVRP